MCRCAARLRSPRRGNSNKRLVSSVFADAKPAANFFDERIVRAARQRTEAHLQTAQARSASSSRPLAVLVIGLIGEPCAQAMMNEGGLAVSAQTQAVHHERARQKEPREWAERDEGIVRDLLVEFEKELGNDSLSAKIAADEILAPRKLPATEDAKLATLKKHFDNGDFESYRDKESKKTEVTESRDKGKELKELRQNFLPSRAKPGDKSPLPGFFHKMDMFEDAMREAIRIRTLPKLTKATAIWQIG